MLISARGILFSPKTAFNSFNKIPHFYIGVKPFTSKPPFSMSADTLTAADSDGATISLEEWQGWGTVSPLPAMVDQVIHDMKLLEKDIDKPMTFGGNRGALTVRKGSVFVDSLCVMRWSCVEIESIG